jgi:hypothetical protein
MSRKNHQWYTLDLHLHTPASSDYQETGVTMLDVLRRAEVRGLSAIAITDHNTVAGYRRMSEEIAFLEMLGKGGRLTAEERSRLEEYRHLLGHLVVFPGFEFTATLGFHLLAVFPPEKSIREIEHILLDLNIPAAQIDLGSGTVGATADVITAYRRIDEAGGLVIAAHANSTNGVAMRGFDFGGQTKIAYTQDPHLHALEVTDLELRGRRSTAAFFNGAKPEYPRRMHCIQGSDCHRLRTDPANRKNLGVGDRATEVLLGELSFSALRELFLGNDFSRTRVHHASQETAAFDFIQSAREEGATIVQDFHESMVEKGGKLYDIIADVCAFANTNGGTLFLGMGSDPKIPPLGVPEAAKAVALLEREVGRKISPAISVAVDIQETGGKQIIRVIVPRGEDPPYAVEGSKIYVRDEDETDLAVRDEIVTLVERKQKPRTAPAPEAPSPPEAAPVAPAVEGGIAAPRTGVEVVTFEERDGVRYFTVRDLRNGNMVKNVTLTSARRLWHYAIVEHAKMPAPESLAWQGDLALLRKRSHRGDSSYDLCQRTPDGIRYYFGVSEDGIHGEWKRLVGAEEE